MINLRGMVVVLAAMVGLIGLGYAADQGPRWTCADVRAFVEQHGSIERAERAARDFGIPEWRIRLAKRCLK